MELVYKRERTNPTEKDHEFAKELTEAINSYLNDVKGDEIKESMDVAMLIGRLLMTGDKKENIRIFLRGTNLASMNGIVTVLEGHEEVE